METRSYGIFRFFRHTCYCFFLEKDCILVGEHSTYRVSSNNRKLCLARFEHKELSFFYRTTFHFRKRFITVFSLKFYFRSIFYHINQHAFSLHIFFYNFYSFCYTLSWYRFLVFKQLQFILILKNKPLLFIFFFIHFDFFYVYLYLFKKSFSFKIRFTVKCVCKYVYYLFC